MRPIPLIATLLTVCQLSILPVKAADWLHLFDGKTFNGWEGNLEIFRIEDGSIVGGTLDARIEHNEFLCTKKEFSNFELRLEVLAKGDGVNAGIQFRTRRIPNHHEVIGYQADVGKTWWGKLYDESRRNRILAEPDDSINMDKLVRQNKWNDYVIRCEGPRIQLWLNGVQTVDYTEVDDTVERNGVIAVQIHGGPPSEAWYRNIQIRELP